GICSYRARSPGIDMLTKPEIIETAEQLTAVIHLTVPRSEIQAVMGPAIAEVLAAIAAQGLAPAGPCFSFHWRRPTATTFDFEVGFPVGKTITPTGRVKPGKLAAGKVVRTVYGGGYEGLGAAWGEFCAWIEAEGLAVQESLWECYVAGPESSADPATWRTELNQPLTAG
ncbi:MAG TPA: GyrI-like domain-containing protein, partial [Rhodocyclaceae bacterium]